MRNGVLVSVSRLMVAFQWLTITGHEFCQGFRMVMVLLGYTSPALNARHNQ